MVQYNLLLMPQSITEVNFMLIKEDHCMLQKVTSVNLDVNTADHCALSCSEELTLML